MDHEEKISFRIREDAFVAWLAAWFLQGKKVAIVIGSNIYLHGAKEVELQQSKAWLRHELMHVQQFKKEGTFRFLMKYCWESLRKGYWNNRYEIEARAAANEIDFEKNFKVVSRRRS